jgi:hypothetical protein
VLRPLLNCAEAADSLNDANSLRLGAARTMPLRRGEHLRHRDGGQRPARVRVGLEVVFAVNQQMAEAVTP